MLRILGSQKRLCNGITRRDLLHVGGIGALGLGLNSAAETSLLSASGSGHEKPRARFLQEFSTYLPERFGTCRIKINDVNLVRQISDQNQQSADLRMLIGASIELCEGNGRNRNLPRMLKERCARLQVPWKFILLTFCFFACREDFPREGEAPADPRSRYTHRLPNRTSTIPQRLAG
jgi:hypothetical protein